MKQGAKRVIVGLMILSLVIGYIPHPANAAEHTIIEISEIYGNANSGEQEWIELHSLSTMEINLAGYTLSDNIGVIYTIPTDTVLKANEYLVIQGWSNKLNNTGDSAILANTNSEVVAAEYNFPAIDKNTSWYPKYQRADVPTPGLAHPNDEASGETEDDGESTENDESGDTSEEGTSDEEQQGDTEENEENTDDTEENDERSNDEEAGENDRQDTENESEKGDEEGRESSPYATIGEILISEIVSNPEAGGNEWVELESASDRELDLAGYIFADAIGEFYTLPQTSIIQPGDRIVFFGWGNKLNNTGDSLYLKLPDGSIVDEVIDFPKLDKGESWLPSVNAKGIPTPEEENILLENEQSPSPTPESTPSPTVNPTPEPTITISPLPSPSSVPSSSPSPPNPFPLVTPTPSASPQPTDAPTPLPSPSPELLPLPEIGDVLLSEIMSNPTSDEEEWVELVSTSTNSFSLDGCTLEDAVGEIYTLTTTERIEAEEYLVVSGWGNKLNNTGDSLTLRLPDGTVLDTVVNFPALEKGTTWLPQTNQLGIPSRGQKNTPLPVATPTPTPEAEEPEPSSEPAPSEPLAPTPAPGEVLINEIMSNPLEGDEWIELISKAENELSLNGFEFHDATGGFFTFDSEAVIAPTEFLVVSGWSDKLNNTGDSLALISAEGSVIDGFIEIPAMDKGESWSTDFAAATTPSPREENIPRETPDEENDEGGEEDENRKSEDSEESLLASDSVIINEVFPSPSGGADEWVEFFVTGQVDIDVSGFTLSDEQGVIYTFPERTVLHPSQFFIATGWTGKLNNSGDSVILQTPSGSTITEITYLSIPSDASWGFDGNAYRRTATSTAGSENVFPSSTGGGGGGSSSASSSKSPLPTLLKTSAKVKSLAIDKYDIQISEVVFSGEEDFIELYCAECDADLAGLRVADDKAVFEFPPESTVATGEYVVIHFADAPEDARHAKGVWHFWANKKGLTATDETIFIIDSRGQVEDAVCIANQNGKFSPGEEEDVVLLIKQNQIKAEHPLTESYCFDSRKLKNGASLIRSDHETGYANQDYFASTENTPGSKNPAPPQRADDVVLQMKKVTRISPETVIVEIKNSSGRAIKTEGFALNINEQDVVPLPDVRLFHQKSVFVTIDVEAVSPLTTVHLVDHWNAMGAEWNGEISKVSEGETGLVISEILADPNGADSGNEFIELQCVVESCEANTFALSIGDEVMLIPQSTLKESEFELIRDATVRNSELHVKVIDFAQSTHQIISLFSTETGESYALSNEEYYWTSYMTPLAPNMIVTDYGSNDSDSDGIPDQTEIALELDPSSSDAKNPIAMRLYNAHLREMTNISVAEDADSIHITGSTIPNMKGKLVLHSRQHVYDIVADADGNFSLDITPDIAPGEHTIDLLFEQPNRRFVTLSALQTFEVSRNPQQDWLTDISIYRSLPNPEGKDSKREYVILENPTDSAGWLKGATISNGKSLKILPDTFFTPHQRKVFLAKDLPSLKNKNGELVLSDDQGKEFDRLAWKNAKSGQLYWEGMPPLLTRAIANKAKKSGAARSRYPIMHGPEYVEQAVEKDNLRFLGITENMLQVSNTQGSVTFYPLSENLSAAFLQSSLQQNDRVSIIIVGNTVQAVRKLPPKMIGAPPVSNFYRGSIFLLLLAGVLGIAAVGTTRKISAKKCVQSET